MIGSTVRDLLQEARVRLQEAGVEDARQEARTIMSAVLDASLAHLLAHPEEEVPADHRGRFEEAVKRRSRREPYAYVVGKREFFGLEFEVSSAVLIPRPETELLVERAIEAAGRLMSQLQRDIVAVDLGTGSGAVAIAVAANTMGLRVTGIDSSIPALEVARRNALRNGVSDRVEFRPGNLLDEFRQDIDLLLANLPYVPSGDVDELMPEVAKYEPRSALDGGPDGTALIRRALAQAALEVNPARVLLFEIGHGQGQGLEEYSRKLFPTAEISVERDLAGLERLLTIRRMP